MMRLKHLTLNKIVDIVYRCGMADTPVSILIAAPPGSGKTWSTQSLRESNRVCYINASASPNEHRKLIQAEAPRTSLLINDDIGYFMNRKEEYFTTFSMLIDGFISHTVWKTQQTATMNCSLILCCTDTQFDSIRDDMKDTGLYSRLVPLIFSLSAKTRKAYQDRALSGNIHASAIPPQRKPEALKQTAPKDAIISEYDVDPRLIANIRRMSQFMTEDETEEIIRVAHNTKKEWEI